MSFFTTFKSTWVGICSPSTIWNMAFCVAIAKPHPRFWVLAILRFQKRRSVAFALPRMDFSHSFRLELPHKILEYLVDEKKKKKVKQMLKESRWLLRNTINVIKKNTISISSQSLKSQYKNQNIAARIDNADSRHGIIYERVLLRMICYIDLMRKKNPRHIPAAAQGPIVENITTLE